MRRSETKYSPLARGFITAGAAIGGTIGAPIIVPVFGATCTGIGIYEGAKGKNSDTSKKKVAASTTTGLVTIASTPITGTLGAPFVGATLATAARVVLDSDFSDDDEK